MGWLISEYAPWLVASALLGALASVAFTLRKIELHTPPAGAVEEEPMAAEEPAAVQEEEAWYDRTFAPPPAEEAALEEPEPEPEPEPEHEPGPPVDPLSVAAKHLGRNDPQLESQDFGPGSAQPLPDGSAPSEAFTVKGIAKSMLFHTAESPYFGRARADVWFDSEETARVAGFVRWDED